MCFILHIELQKKQEQRKGGFSQWGFCRIQCHAQDSNNYPRVLGPAVHVALRAPQPREAYILLTKTSFQNPLLFPKDPAVLKIVRVVNSLRVVFLVRQGDLLSRRTLCGHQFPGNYRHFPSPRRVCGVVNLGGVVKTLRRSNFTIFAIAVVFLVRKGPLGWFLKN